MWRFALGPSLRHFYEIGYLNIILMYLCVGHMSAMSSEARRGCWSPEIEISWFRPVIQMLLSELQSSGGTASALSHSTTLFSLQARPEPWALQPTSSCVTLGAPPRLTGSSKGLPLLNAQTPAGLQSPQLRLRTPLRLPTAHHLAIRVFLPLTKGYGGLCRSPQQMGRCGCRRLPSGPTWAT